VTYAKDMNNDIYFKKCASKNGLFSIFTKRPSWKKGGMKFKTSNAHNFLRFHTSGIVTNIRKDNFKFRDFGQPTLPKALF
jgi:hypothetical protein